MPRTTTIPYDGRPMTVDSDHLATAYPTVASSTSTA